MLDGLEEDVEGVHLWDVFPWPQYGNCNEIQIPWQECWATLS